MTWFRCLARTHTHLQRQEPTQSLSRNFGRAGRSATLRQISLVCRWNGGVMAGGRRQLQGEGGAIQSSHSSSKARPLLHCIAKVTATPLCGKALSGNAMKPSLRRCNVVHASTAADSGKPGIKLFPARLLGAVPCWNGLDDSGWTSFKPSRG